MENLKIKNRIDYLVRIIKYYEYMIHVKGENPVEEEVYDALRSELERLERDFPQFIREDSPTNYVSTVSGGYNKIISREIPMLSLRHTYNKEEIFKIFNDFFKMDEKIIIEPKIDGVAISIVYIEGICDSISLRGDGWNGEDITFFGPYIKGIPMRLSEDISIEVRGEVFLPKIINQENRRNFIAGYLRRKVPEDVGAKFVAYKLIKDEVKTQEESLDFLTKHGFLIPYFREAFDPEAAIEICHEIWSMDFEFEIDGVVSKINNLIVGKEAGNTARYPRDAVAYKFSPERRITEVKEIKWQITKNGILKPVCVLDPINVDGAIITRATAHNKRNLFDKQIGIGAKVSIVRVGNVVPQIMQVIQSGEFSPLTNCPFCNLKIIETEIDYICQNENCSEKNKQKILYFFETIGLKGFGEKKIEKYKNLSIPQMIQMLKTDTWIEDLNDKKVAKLFSLIRNKINLPLIIIALGIEGIGKSSINSLNITNLESMSDLGGKRGEIFNSFINQNKDLIQKILESLRE